MENLDAHIEFVKQQVEFHQRQAKRFAAERRRSAMHIAAEARFAALLEGLEKLRLQLIANPNALAPQATPKAKRLALSWEEVQGLPPELMEELSISESDKTEFGITSLITDLGGVASLDRIIIGLFHQTQGEITKRSVLNQRLYRMVNKEMIHSVPGKKGVYSIEPISEDDAAKLN